MVAKRASRKQEILGGARAARPFANSRASHAHVRLVDSEFSFCVSRVRRIYCSADDAAVNMTKTCSEKHLAKISVWIKEWRDIATFLDLTEAEEHEILGSAPHSVRSQKKAMLRLWKEKRGTKATYKRLCRAFRDCEMLDLEEKVEKLLVESSSSSSDEEGVIQRI